MGTLVSGLAARGKLSVVGVPQDELKLNAFPLVFGGRSIYGSLTATPIDGGGYACLQCSREHPTADRDSTSNRRRMLTSHDARQGTLRQVLVTGQ
jgi:hypothetical protein